MRYKYLKTCKTGNDFHAVEYSRTLGFAMQIP